MLQIVLIDQNCVYCLYDQLGCGVSSVSGVILIGDVHGIFFSGGLIYSSKGLSVDVLSESLPDS